jgi:hypothetical protein
MMKAFPKAFVVVSVLVGSTVLFTLWWVFGRSEPVVPQATDKTPQPTPAVVDTSNEAAAGIPEKIDHLLMIDDDLWDIEAGELLMADWLEGDLPNTLSYDEETQSLIGQFSRGIVRYDLSGRIQGTITRSDGLLFSDAFDSILYAEGGDIWRAGIDWAEFAVMNPQQVTSIGSFSDRSFTGNVLLGSPNNLIVRNRNQFLRVDLKAGEVATTPMNMNGLVRRRSPEGNVIVGGLSQPGGTLFYAYHLDENRQEVFELGNRLAVTDYLWLNDRSCAFLVANQIVGLYEMEPEGIREIVKLPFPCRGLVGPSPGGGFVLAAGTPGLVMVDLHSKEAEKLTIAAEQAEWLEEGVLLLANGGNDTQFRGTWKVGMGAPPKRITNQPFLGDRSGRTLAKRLEGDAGLVFVTQSGLFHLQTGSTEAIALGAVKGRMPVLTTINRLAR